MTATTGYIQWACHRAVQQLVHRGHWREAEKAELHSADTVGDETAEGFDARSFGEAAFCVGNGSEIEGIA